MFLAPVYRLAKHVRPAAAGLLLLTLAGCAHRTAASLPARIGSTETGIASWYGPPYHGRRTASGEIYDMEKLTAAHKRLPFQTWVQVTNLGNGKQVDVRITDRGPFAGGRIIDLSLAAARDIDMVRQGTTRVRLKVIAPPTHRVTGSAADSPSAPASAPAAPRARPSDSGAYAVQAGAFADRWRAEALRASLAFEDVRVVPASSDPALWRVFIGRALDAEAASALAARVRESTGAALVVPDR